MFLRPALISIIMFLFLTKQTFSFSFLLTGLEKIIPLSFLKFVVEYDMSTCIKEFYHERILNPTKNYSCNIHFYGEKIQLYYDEEKSGIFSPKKIFHLKIGNDIECAVEFGKAKCAVLKH
ncbi:MAG: hypothetical protein GXO21_06690 [Aquificae bacterium]|nr:hypothetical protein [Aquificota bacterium]